MLFRRKASEVFNEILGRKKQSWWDIFKEILEFLDALTDLNWDEAELELEQVLYAFQMQFYQITKIDFYLKGCEKAVEGFYARRNVWLEIFDEFKIEFKNEYLEHGSNYRRAYKIKKALELAGVEIDAKKASELCLKYLSR